MFGLQDILRGRMPKPAKKKVESGLQLSRVLNALGDPVRLEIVRQIHRDGETPCGGFGMDMPKSSLSHHFRVLREAGVLGVKPEGTSILNFLLADELEKNFPGLLAGILRNL
jgi:DNA-binding transcriptional ArsR family regulator